MTSHTVGMATIFYGYDLAGQLTSEVRPSGTVTYDYDANDNRAWRQVGSA